MISKRRLQACHVIIIFSVSSASLPLAQFRPQHTTRKAESRRSKRQQSDLRGRPEQRPPARERERERRPCRRRQGRKTAGSGQGEASSSCYVQGPGIQPRPKSQKRARAYTVAGAPFFFLFFISLSSRDGVTFVMLMEEILLTLFRIEEPGQFEGRGRERSRGEGTGQRERREMANGGNVLRRSEKN